MRSSCASGEAAVKSLSGSTRQSVPGQFLLPTAFAPTTRLTERESEASATLTLSKGNINRFKKELSSVADAPGSQTSLTSSAVITARQYWVSFPEASRKHVENESPSCASSNDCVARPCRSRSRSCPRTETIAQGNLLNKSRGCNADARAKSEASHNNCIYSTPELSAWK